MDRGTWASQVTQVYIIHLPVQEMKVQSLAGREDLLEKKMTTYSSILAWEISWTEQPGRHSPWRNERVQHDLATTAINCEIISPT